MLKFNGMTRNFDVGLSVILTIEHGKSIVDRDLETLVAWKINYGCYIEGQQKKHTNA